jgi:hypothetical protein
VPAAAPAEPEAEAEPEPAPVGLLAGTAAAAVLPSVDGEPPAGRRLGFFTR